jgi:CRP/FNR family cyclic AMP-dependent transcriptional regulator
MNHEEELIAELKKVPWFNELKPEHFKRIKKITVIRNLKQGATLFHEGDKEDFLYVVLEGRIALDMHVPTRGKVIFDTADPWDLVGWSSATPTVRQRTAGAIAVLDSVVACVDAEELRKLCEQDHDLGYLVMLRLANIIASRLMVTRLQLIDMFATPPETKNDD